MNEENIRKHIRLLLEEIQSEADPVLLNRCRSIFRKEVSFFHRSYMAAYLLLKAENISGSRERPERKENKSRKFQAKAFQEEALRSLSSEESVKLFISIGRNRKVFPREILSLINAKANLEKDDIGTIRILDNYSFVQVRNSAAETVIEALNGQNFRGRTLTVNYARSRREGEEETYPAEQTEM